MTRYTVTAERSGRWWVLQAKEAPGAISQVTYLSQADVIKEAIAFVTDDDASTIELDVVPVVPADVVTHLERSKELRLKAERAQAESADETRQAISALIEQGMSLRDIGWFVGLSYQRVHQIAKGGVRPGSASDVA